MVERARHPSCCRRGLATQDQTTACLAPQDPWPGWAIALVAVGVLLTQTIFLFTIYRLRKKKKEAKRKAAEQAAEAEAAAAAAAGGELGLKGGEATPLEEDPSGELKLGSASEQGAELAQAEEGHAQPLPPPPPPPLV